ncbi:hypothetical protein BGI35_09540 [Snodgrassella communis]|nr:hypothetical protein BGI35_09540 [Snodgrassella communis]
MALLEIIATAIKLCSFTQTNPTLSGQYQLYWPDIFAYAVCTILVNMLRCVQTVDSSELMFLAQNDYI